MVKGISTVGDENVIKGGGGMTLWIIKSHWIGHFEMIYFLMYREFPQQI